MSLSDEALARLLQAELDEEEANGATNSANQGGAPSHRAGSSSSKPLSLIDTQWELLDPTPDPRALFMQFNVQFFWGKLEGVEVRWSPRMTLCAGVCSYEGFGGLCSIRLSNPLLKLRPRKDLVETLLHEMIHAYLFVTQNNRDRDGHGPEFCKHKDRINIEAGTEITIYHNFHDEVENYRQHWWRCDGPCRTRKPYFGYVKRAMNRAPSRQDTWWASHQQTCRGTYTKVKEPEGYSKKKRKKDGGDSEKENDSEAAAKKQKRESQDIRDFIPFAGHGHRLGGSFTGKVPGPAVPPNRSNDTGESGNGHHSGGPNSADAQNRADSLGNTFDQDIKLNGPRKKQINGTKSSQKRKVFDLAKREGKLEELRTIFLSDSEDDGEDDGESSISKKNSGKGLSNGSSRNGMAREGSSSIDGGHTRPGTGNVPYHQGKRVPGDISSDKNNDGHQIHSGGENTASGRILKTPWTKSIPGDKKNTVSGAGQKSVDTSIGTTNASGARPKVGTHRNRDISRPSGSHTGLTNVVDIGDGVEMSCNRSDGRGVNRTEHPSGQSSLDSFVNNRQRGSGVPPNSHTQGGATSGGGNIVQGDGVRHVECPMCGKDIIEREINSHLDSCQASCSRAGSSPRTTNVMDVSDDRDVSGNRSDGRVVNRTKRPPGRSSLDSIADNRQRGAGVPPNNHALVGATSGSGNIVRGDSVRHVKCPVCGKDIHEGEINRHLDSCLSGFS